MPHSRTEQDAIGILGRQQCVLPQRQVHRQGPQGLHGATTGDGGAGEDRKATAGSLRTCQRTVPVPQVLGEDSEGLQLHGGSADLSVDPLRERQARGHDVDTCGRSLANGNAEQARPSAGHVGKGAWRTHGTEAHLRPRGARDHAGPRELRAYALPGEVYGEHRVAEHRPRASEAEG